MKTTTLKTKAMSILLTIVMLLGMLPMGAFAADTPPSYVALGDSISTGYGLADKTTQGFAYMLANSLGYTLTNLAVDGNTAAGILEQLEDASVKTAVAGADLITITVGGNDLMAALYQALADYYNTQYGLTGDAAVSGNDIVDAFAGNDSNLSLTMTDMNAMLGIVANFATTQNFTDALDSYTTNMFGDSGVIKTILALNPNVKIVVTTQYNPYIVFDGAFLYGNLYTGIEAGLSGDNGLNAVINSNAASEGYIVADVYTAFKNSSDNLCNAGTVGGKTNLDFHPNAAGHYVLANTVAYACNPTGYSVTFDANGGTGYMATVYASGIYDYPECSFTAPEGYRFAGWLDSANGRDFEPVGMGIYLYENITLYAGWELIPTLSTPTNLRWNGMVAEWDAVEGADGYTVEFRYSTGSGGGGNTGYYYTNYIDYSYADSSTPWRFRVKAKTNSGDAVSEWSDWSDIVTALEPGQLTAPILPDWQGFWPNWRVASEFDSAKHKFVATLYKEGVTDAIAVVEGMPPLDINELIREKGSGTYYFTVKTVSLDAAAESKTVTSPQKAIDVDTIPQLAAPTNLRWNDTKAEWDAVEGATKYYFELFRDGSRVMTGDNYDTYDELGFLFDEDDLGAGVYTFRVTALAQENGVTLAQAVSAMSGKYIALDAPQNIAWDGTVARWGSVENATGYRVYLDCPDELPTQISNVSDTQKDMKEYFTEAGDYTFYVYAYAEVEGYGGQMLSRESASAVYAYDPEAYTVTFNANGGTGYTANVHVSGDYTLPACPFIAPAGYEFKAWSVGGTEYAAGEKITVSADTTVTAVWEKLPAEAPTVTAGSNLTLTYKGYTNQQVSVSVTEKTGYTYSYQWYDGNNQPISEATNSTYTVPNDLAAGSYSYYCVVTAKRDDNGETQSSQSSAIAVTVNKATLTADDFDFEKPAILVFHYSGNKHATVTPKDGVTGVGDITVQYIDEQGQTKSFAYNAGTYTVKINVAEGANYLAADSLTADGWTFTITKGTQNAPTGIVGVAETVYGKNDGKITGVYDEMEYRKASETDADYKAITGEEITGLAAGTYYVRVKETDNLLASPPATVTIAAGRMLTITVPSAAEQIGYTVEAQASCAYGATVEIKITALEGYGRDENFDVYNNGNLVSNNYNSATGILTLENVTEDVSITLASGSFVDRTKPTAEITIGTNKWNTFWNNLTFDLFFKETQTVTITADDKGSGLDKVYYYISESEMERSEVMNITAWQEYTGAFNIDPDRVAVIYVKAVDKAGNLWLVNSDGLVLDATAPTLEGIENGKTYYGDLTVIIPADQFGDIEQVTLDGEKMNFEEGTRGLIPADNAEHTVVATDRAGNKTEYRIKVYKVYEITFKHPTFELGFPVNHGISFNDMYTDIDANEDLAASKDDHTFIGWYESTDGGETLKDTPYDFGAKVTGDVTLYPLFEKTTYTVDIGECHYVGCVISGGGSYQHGQTVTVTATPTDGTEFKYWLDADIAAGWEDDPSEAELRAAIVSYDATYTFTAEKDVSLEAVFSGSDEIAITAMLIAGTDQKSLLDAEWMDVEYDFGSITPGAEQITLPGEIIEDTVTIGEKHYRFAGFITFGYDEATDTETAELKETLTIGAMPLYGSAEYWDWFNSISDGLYAAYMEYTPDDPQEPDDPQTPDDPQEPDDPQKPNDPETPDDPQKPNEPETPDNPDNPKNPSSLQTGDNSNMALWFALLLLSGGAILTLTVYDRKRRTANR